MKKVVFVLLIICCFILCGCGYQENGIDENKFNIVTSFYPMYVATSNIVDGVVERISGLVTGRNIVCDILKNIGKSKKIYTNLTSSSQPNI